MLGIDGFWIPGDLDAHFMGVDDSFGGNPEAEALAQLRFLMQGDAGLYDDLTATESAHVDVICERLRLFYVGLTRARRYLHISRSRTSGSAGREKHGRTGYGAWASLRLSARAAVSGRLMEIVIPFALALALIFTANKVTASENQEAHKGYTLLLLLLNTLAAFLGLLLLLFPGENLARSLTGMLAVDNHTSLAWILFAMGLWGILCCLPPIRQGLSRIMPLDANSAVHMTALMLAGYLLGNTALALSENLLQQLSALDLAVSVVEVVLQQAGFVLLAFGGTGLFIRRDLAGVRQRLGLQVPTPGQLILGIGVIFLLIFIQGTAGAVWALIDPEQAQELGSINESLLAGFDSVGEWFVLAACLRNR